MYELIAYNTDSRYPQDVRYRKYTSSKKLAEQFNKIPKIQFTDSGHGIVFHAREKEKGIRYPERRELADYVDRCLKAMKPEIRRISAKDQQITCLLEENEALKSELSRLRARLHFYVENE